MLVAMLVLVPATAQVGGEGEAGPYVDQLWWSMVIGPDAQLSALLEHEVAAGDVPRPEDLEAIELAGFTTPSTVRLKIIPLFENNAIYPCNDRAFRKAVNRLVDKDTLTELLYPLQSPLEYWLPPSMGEWVADGQWDEGWGQYRPDYRLPQFKPGMPTDTGTDSAYSWLNDNGYTMTNTPNPWYDEATSPDWASPYIRSATGDNVVMPEIEYVTRPHGESPLYYEHAQIINLALHQAGINSKLTPKTWLEIVAILTNTDYTDYSLLTGVGLVWGSPEPEIQYDLYRSDQLPLWNLWVYSDPDMDAACDAIKSTLDYNELKAATMLTQELLARDEPMLPVMLDNGFTAFEGPSRDAQGNINWPYEPGSYPGHIGIVNQLGVGATGGSIADDLVLGPHSTTNKWGKLIGRSGRTTSPEEINAWYLGSYLDTLNPLTANTVPDWQILDLVMGHAGLLNPYTMAYMPWALAQEPTQEPWDGTADHPVIGTHMSFRLEECRKWHDGTPVTAADAVFGLDLMRFQEVERYRSIWEPIYDVVQTGDYTWEVYYDLRYYFAARKVGNICFFTPKHIWEPFIQPEVDSGAGPMCGDVWTGWADHHAQWQGWRESLGPDTYNGYPEMELTKLIGFGPFIYHLGGWDPGISSHVEANRLYFGGKICPGDVNLDHICDDTDRWHAFRRLGHEEYMPIWYQYLGADPPLQGTSVDIAYPAQIIDFGDYSVVSAHYGHVWGPGYTPCITPDVGSISGTVTLTCFNSPIAGVQIDLYDAAGPFITSTTTADDGTYSFPDLYPGDYMVTIVPSAPYIVAVGEETVPATVVASEDTIVDFVLQFKLVDEGKETRAIGYWKHQVNAWLTGKGKSQETQENLTIWLGIISDMSDVFEFTPETELEEAQAILNIGKDASMENKAKQRLLALWLNVVSGKLATHATTDLTKFCLPEITTISEAILYCEDNLAANPELVKDISDAINNGKVLV